MEMVRYEGFAYMKSYLRSRLPGWVWDGGAFLRHLPRYWIQERDANFRHRNGCSTLEFFLGNDIHVRCPPDLTAYICFQYHLFLGTAERQELKDFLTLGEDCESFIDVGAQCGTMSALFARSREHRHRIVSVEPDPSVLPILEATRRLNETDSSVWTIRNLALGERVGFAEIPRTNYLYDEEQGGSTGKTMEIKMTTLENLVAEDNIKPDLVKIDVEGFEYEILMSSWKLMENHKPALHLEVHWQLLNDRGRQADEFLRPLADLGYRGIRRCYRGMDAWRRARSRESVSRIAMRIA
jgi:FkbM family methyltransferase